MSSADPKTMKEMKCGVCQASGMCSMFNIDISMFCFCEHGAGTVSRRFQSSVTQCLVVAFFSDGDGVCDQQERNRRGQKNDRGMTLYDSSIYGVSLLLRSRHAVVGFGQCVFK